ncbi:hypothetical protein LAZ67_5001167 [Cordylochernes scorpioides]|uniref:Copia protein n=1 Tax=Cordylochernes scorpioides TaxID=51811 RepID=A0ABY6KFD4_9ARAC|nr:hypothetical protein LAZ67_5001167 [Cordylochernes scorpioides]
MNSTLIDKVRTKLAETNLPIYLWGEAIYCSAYELNSSPKVQSVNSQAVSQRSAVGSQARDAEGRRPDFLRRFRKKLKFVCLLKMTTELPQIQKFNGDNFHLWKFQMKIILEAKDLLSITDGSEVKPEIEDIAKFSNWKKKDAKSKMLITAALEFKYLQQIVNCQTSAEMWKKLSTI